MMRPNELVNQIQQRYVRELNPDNPNEMPYFVGFLTELTDDERLTQAEGMFAVWLKVDQTPHLLTVQLVDGTYEVQGVPQGEWMGVNVMMA
jgi:hypothetical protein